MLLAFGDWRRAVRPSLLIRVGRTKALMLSILTYSAVLAWIGFLDFHRYADRFLSASYLA